MERLGDFFANLVRRILPDPIVIACGLTLIVAAIALIVPQDDGLAGKGLLARVPALAEMWLGAVWSPKFLAFALQMCVVLLTGYGLAKAPPAMRGLHALAALAGSNRSAVLLVTAVSCVGCWINWGFGLIASGVLAARVREELKAKGVRCQYALIVAGAYAGMMIWHGGLSGSAPLKVAKDGVLISRTVDGQAVAEQLDAIDIASTTLSPGNIGLTLVLCIGIPLLMRSMASAPPRAEHAAANDAPGPAGSSATARGSAGETTSGCPAVVETALPGEAAESASDRERSVADLLNESRVIPLLIAAAAAIALVTQLAASGTAAINLNFVNTVFLTLGLLLHRNLVAYARAIAEGGRAVTGIVLQFPLYSGIQGIMFGAGLAAALSQAFVDGAAATAEWLHVSAAHTFPVATFLSAGLVNVFVPSGGGQWIVQGPIMCGAAVSLNTPIEQTVLAVSYGDQWTNMIQPFWAIPLMGLTGVNVRRFMGYCALLMLLAGPVFVLALLLF